MAEFSLGSPIPMGFTDSTRNPIGGQSYGLSVITPAVAGGGATFRMRGFDTTLTTQVFWASDTEDPTGANYTGPGPLTDVVVFARIGVP